ncbi:hypothetical protein BVRB_4g096080 [Beta vulgaris subsp. vulgaris]|uniref:Uncharacterized protein n=1 Tax=Beta vulgaris subsp. vulgaris TaxID=3555 RepID=A0A0J8BAZ2_BETVV|nr:hypothetical protein BVRB_4g096080 [Beta vulgaris subsp. vulgaris]
MAQEMGLLIPYVGGIDHAIVLLPPLETLCTVEETCVTDKVVHSLSTIASQMKESDLVQSFFLCLRVWPLVSGLLLVFLHVAYSIIAYPSAPENIKSELRTIYG